MINSVGLANPGLERVRREKLPWIRQNVRNAQVLVSVAGHTPAHYQTLVRSLSTEEGFLGFELNLSCPNDTKRGGRPFVLDPDALREVVSTCRALTDRPLVVKLAPHDPDLETTVRVVEGEGADGLTLVNTLPGLVFDPLTGSPGLGAGEGGVSGPALRPAGVRAVAVARGVTALPLLGAGGIVRTEDALQYLRAGASLLQVGTATFAAPRSAETIARELPAVVTREGLAWPPAAPPRAGSSDHPVEEASSWAGTEPMARGEASWRR
jgi:dihydroorotate dehydrogenase (NAD+) catalytic subunit